MQTRLVKFRVCAGEQILEKFCADVAAKKGMFELVLEAS